MPLCSDQAAGKGLAGASQNAAKAPAYYPRPKPSIQSVAFRRIRARINDLGTATLRCAAKDKMHFAAPIELGEK
jgi:hypothetical protein